VITGQYAPDYGPSAPIYTALCEDLQRMGCDVTVVTAFPHYGGADAAANGAHARLPSSERRNGVRVLRSWIYTVPRSSLWRRLLYHASFNITSTLAAMRAARPDVVLGDAPTLWSGLPLLVHAVLRRTPFVYTVHDVYPDILVKLGVLRNARAVAAIDRVERFFYRRAVKVSVLTDGFKEALLRKEVPAAKIDVIPACVDVEHIRPLPKENALRQRLGLAGKFVVLYAGNLGMSQGLETVLDAAERLTAEPRVTFAFVGEGPSRAGLEARARDRGLRNVVFTSFFPREEVPLVYAMADVSLVALKHEIVGESVPSKTYTIMASGRPVVATVNPRTEVGAILARAGCGCCVPPEDAGSLADAISSLLHDGALREAMGARGRSFAVEHYGREVASRRYLEIVRDAARGGRA
jgi:colanic acid biosynthesis glycosyl transferase WcaI